MDNTAFQSTKQPKRPAGYANDSILEALRDLGSGVGKTVARDVAGKVASDALSSLFGTVPKQGEMHANESINFHPAERAPAQKAHHPETNHAARVTEDQAKMKQQLEAVRAELKALSASMHSLNVEVQKAIAEVPVQPGIYHLNFFERLKNMLQILREQIDDSRSWMTMHSTRKQKKGYWGMYKKHGTSFGLSNERSLATQAG